MTTTPATRNWRPYMMLIVGLLAVSTAALFIRNAQNAGATSLAIAAFRLCLASTLITPAALRYRHELFALTPRQLGLGLVAGVLLGLHFATWITSLEYTSVISSVVLVTTTPIWVALLTPFLLREKLNPLIFGAIVLGIIGSVIVSVTGDPGTAPKQDQPVLGNLLALAGAIAIALNFLIGRSLRARLSVTPYIWLTYSGAAITLLVMMIGGGQSFLGLSNDAYLWMILLALVPQLIGHTAYNYALGYVSAAYVGVISLGEPIFGAILAFLFLQEVPKPLQLVGSAVIFAALLLSTRAELSKNASQR
jgi:drug/metabolite transporter (DMT)-like permease